MVKLRILFFRVLFKAVSWVLHLITAIRSMRIGGSDFSDILIENLPIAKSGQVSPLKPLDRKNTILGIIIPFRDKWPLTEKCLQSVESQIVSGNVSIRIYLIDNGSVEKRTKDGCDAYQQNSKFEVAVIPDKNAFNFSAINNKAAKIAQQDGCSHLLFLNNDIEIESHSSLNELIEAYFSIKNACLLGCTLQYPNKTVQHLFAAPGFKIVAAHPFKGMPLNLKSKWHQSPRQVPAITGAVMLTSVSNFFAVNGFDENLPTLGQDIDLCLSFQKKTFEIWVATSVVFTHHEGLTRGDCFDREQIHYIYNKWGEHLVSNPVFSTRISRWSETPVYSLGEPAFPWTLVIP